MNRKFPRSPFVWFCTHLWYIEIHRRQRHWCHCHFNFTLFFFVNLFGSDFLGIVCASVCGTIFVCFFCVSSSVRFGAFVLRVPLYSRIQSRFACIVTAKSRKKTLDEIHWTGKKERNKKKKTEKFTRSLRTNMLSLHTLLRGLFVLRARFVFVFILFFLSVFLLQRKVLNFDSRYVRHWVALKIIILWLWRAVLLLPLLKNATQCKTPWKSF